MGVGRRMWRLYEPIHVLSYFAPESLAAYEAAGLRGYWRGYFAGRVAPLGAVGAAPVVAIFFNFAPGMVARALPSVWELATPAEALAARAGGAEAALRRVLAGVADDDIAEAAELTEAAVALLDPAGTPLGAANAALTGGDGSPVARLWQATAALREHRGDAHVAALLTHGFDGCAAAVWPTLPGGEERMRAARGWTVTEWEAAAAALVKRGWQEPDGRHTPEGEAAYAAVEAATDRHADRVWDLLGPERTARLTELLLPMARIAFPELPPMPIRLPAPPAD